MIKHFFGKLWCVVAINNGVGMCMVVSPDEKNKIASEIPLDGEVYPHIIEVGQIK